MVFFIDEARSRPPPSPRLLTNVNKKMFFFNEGFPKLIQKRSIVGYKYFERKNKDLESDYDLE